MGFVVNETPYLLTPWCRVLPEQLTGLQLVKKFPEFHGTRRFITALTSVRHLSVSWASPIQSKYPHPTSWRSSLILSTHLRLGLPIGLFPSVFPTKTLYTPPPQRNAWVVLIPGQRFVSHGTDGWMDTKVGLDGCGKSRPHWDSIPGTSVPCRASDSRQSC
jgi:hypothetical protein